MSDPALPALGAADVAAVMTTFADALEAHRDTINRLNVYPVPDGDTGTNMHLTLDSVVGELRDLPDHDDLAAVCAAMSHGSLMGARGNSGVILCQVLRGVAGCFSGAAAEGRELDGAVLAEALDQANEAARAGVMRPVEGTILTVASAASEGATAASEGATAASGGATAASGGATAASGGATAIGGGAGGGSLVEVAEAARASAVESLAQTPELLPVLKKAGVVDAGGAGLTLLFDALLHVIDGRPMPEALPLPAAVLATLERGSITESLDEGALIGNEGGAGEDAVGELRYEVMYFLEASDELVPAFKRVWAGIGDSIVVVGGDGLWNCHIHTDDIGAAVEAALDAGRPRKIRVTDLHEQVEEESWVRQASESAPSAPEADDAEPTPVTSVIAVATGDGVRRIFHSLGVRHIVTGGQSMNPSTAEILDMIEGVEGAEVVILPNNKNIYAVAAQAANVSSKPAKVIPTPGVQEGFAALLEYDPEACAGDNAQMMSEAAARVVAGEVTQAVRASDTNAGHVEAGDWIGLTRSGIEVVGDSCADAVCNLLDHIVQPSHEIVTIIEGAGSRPADTRRITEWLNANRPAASVELHQGGQPLYPYLVAAE